MRLRVISLDILRKPHDGIAVLEKFNFVPNGWQGEGVPLGMAENRTGRSEPGVAEDSDRRADAGRKKWNDGRCFSRRMVGSAKIKSNCRPAVRPTSG